jgi:hypothetical protein
MSVATRWSGSVLLLITTPFAETQLRKRLYWFDFDHKDKRLAKATGQTRCRLSKHTEMKHAEKTALKFSQQSKIYFGTIFKLFLAQSNQRCGVF